MNPAATAPPRSNPQRQGVASPTAAAIAARSEPPAAAGADAMTPTNRGGGGNKSYWSKSTDVVRRAAVLPGRAVIGLSSAVIGSMGYGSGGGGGSRQHRRRKSGLVRRGGGGGKRKGALRGGAGTTSFSSYGSTGDGGCGKGDCGDAVSAAIDGNDGDEDASGPSRRSVRDIIGSVLSPQDEEGGDEDGAAHEGGEGTSLLPRRVANGRSPRDDGGNDRPASSGPSGTGAGAGAGVGVRILSTMEGVLRHALLVAVSYGWGASSADGPGAVTTATYAGACAFVLWLACLIGGRHLSSKRRRRKRGVHRPGKERSTTPPPPASSGPLPVWRQNDDGGGGTRRPKSLTPHRRSTSARGKIESGSISFDGATMVSVDPDSSSSPVGGEGDGGGVDGADSAVVVDDGATASRKGRSLSLPPSPTYEEEDLEGDGDVDADGKGRRKKRKPQSPGAEEADETSRHPELSKLCILNASTMERIATNSDCTARLDNDMFSGEVCLMIRTPDVDGDRGFVPPGGSRAGEVSDYFRDKQRQFEFQFQVKLKKLPPGPIYLGCELEEPIKMGMVQRAFVGAVLNMVKKLNNGFHYAFGGTDGLDEGAIRGGRYEKAHLAFMLEASMDRLVATKPGDPIPILGEPVQEDPESIKMRKRIGTGSVQWNLDDTYTMSLWSAYVNFLSWKCLNFPGIRPFSLTSVAGEQPINLILYCLNTNGMEPDVRRPHYQCDMLPFTHLELSNFGKTTGGFASEWLALQEGKQSSTATIVPVESVDDDDRLEEEGISVVEEIAAPNEEEEVEELGDGMYLKSGDPIVLQEALELDDQDERAIAYVTNGKGFAVLQSQASSTPKIIIQKASAAYQTGPSNSRNSKLIHSGDTVMLKFCIRDEVKYLSTHRGWWLKWVSTAPRHNGYFRIFAHEPTNDDVDMVEHGTPLSPYIAVGAPFSLRHRRWSHYEVGVTAERSATFGGRILGLHRVSNAHDRFEGGSSERSFDEPDYVDGKGTKHWLQQLRLCANLFSKTVDIDGRNIQKAPAPGVIGRENDKELGVGLEHGKVRLDVSAWVELMHRTSRRRQRAYVVRVYLSENGVNESENKESFENESEVLPSTSPREDTSIENNAFIRLRSGRDLTPFLQMGRSGWNSSAYGSEDMGNEQSARPTHSDKMPGSNFDSFPGGAVPSSFPDDGVEEVPDFAKGTGTLEGQPGDVEIAQRGLDGDVPDTLSCRSGSTVSRRKSEGDLSESASACHRKTSSSFAAQIFDFSGREEDDDVDINGDGGRYYSDEWPDESSVEHQTSSEVEGDMDVESRPGEPITSNDTNSEVSDDAVDENSDTQLEGGELAHGGTSMNQHKKHTKHAGGMGRVAKTVKHGTALTGKHVIKKGKKVTVTVGKGTALTGKHVVKQGRLAGRALIGKSNLHSTRPPVREPRTPKRGEKDSIKRRGKDHHVAVNKAMKSKSRSRNSLSSKYALPRTMAALSPPDQSALMVSHVLSDMSSLSPSRAFSQQISKLMTAELASPSEFDAWFLRGDAADIGVVPARVKTGQLLHESLVARGLWESHWREEWCGIYDSHLSFYAPLTKKPVFSIAFEDVHRVRRANLSDDESPLPGFPLLVIETAWRCHYVAFISSGKRDSFQNSLNDAIFSFGSSRDRDSNALPASPESMDAHLWKSFQSSVQSSLSSGRGKWAPVSSGKKSRQRIMFNGRSMSFDVKPLPRDQIAPYVENLLSLALSFSLDSLEKSPNEFVSFLDKTSRLSVIPLNEFDFSGREEYCIFVNVYHCLLQHALLLAVNGPPDRGSVGHFMRCTCYEIGGDVFSLAELRCLVIRGHMSSAVKASPPFIDAPKASRAHLNYALQRTDPRINFVLNIGTLAYPPTVPVLKAPTLDSQMRSACETVLRQDLVVDRKKRTIVLPKVCEVYRNDFGDGDPLSCVLFCIKFVGEEAQNAIMDVLNESGGYLIKYHPSCNKFHSKLAKARTETTINRRSSIELDT